MRRVRGNSRGLSEIVGTLILILIVVAAATALSVFVTGYEKTVLSQEANTHERTLESYTIFGVNVPETFEIPAVVTGIATWDLASTDTSTCSGVGTPPGLSYSGAGDEFMLSAPTGITGTFGVATIIPAAASCTAGVVSQPFSVPFTATEVGTLTGASLAIIYNDSFMADQTPSGTPSVAFAAGNVFVSTVQTTPVGYYIFDVASTTVESSQISSMTINNEPVLWYCALPPDAIVTSTSTCTGGAPYGLGGTWVTLGSTTRFAPLQEYEILVNYDDANPGLLYNGCNSFNTSIIPSSSCALAPDGWPSITATGTLRIAFNTLYDNTFSQVMRAPIAIASVGTIAIPESEGGGSTLVLDGAASVQLGGNDSILAWYWIVTAESPGATAPTVPYLSGEEIPFNNTYWSPTSGTYLIQLLVIDGTGLWNSDTIVWQYTS